MVKAFGSLLTFAFCGVSKKDRFPCREEAWFRIEYGKEWKHALQHYKETGSIHWNG